MKSFLSAFVLSILSMTLSAGEKAIMTVTGYPINSIVISYEDGSQKIFPLEPVAKKSESVHAYNLKLLEALKSMETSGFVFKGQVGQLGSTSSSFLFEKKN